MATIRDYYNTDFNTMMIHADWSVSDKAGSNTATIRARVHQDWIGNAKYWSFYIPDTPDYLSNIVALFKLDLLERCTLTPKGDPAYFEVGFADYSERVNSGTFVFTKRVYIYIDKYLDPTIRSEITQHGLERGYYVVVRDAEFAAKKSEMEKPLAFISHDSKDKDQIVRELARELTLHMCPVWYDEYSLRVGESLRESIEMGLKEAKKCVLILSPNFLKNEGWAKAEFDSIYVREVLDLKGVILPVWHNVNVKQVYEYSPRLAGKVGLSSSIGVKELARKLAQEIKA